MEKNVSSVAEQDKTAEVKKNPKLIELARPYKFDDKDVYRDRPVRSG